MKGETSWVNHCHDSIGSDFQSDAFLELEDEGNKEGAAVSMNLILPDDLIECIFSFLPIVMIFRAGCVCKRWKKIVSSQSFLRNFSTILSQKPWYYMFTSSDEPVGCVYDPVLKNWYGMTLPWFDASNWSIASSCGLVCFMEIHNRNELYVGNPITNHYRSLAQPPATSTSDYSALAISVNRTSHSYSVSVVTSKHQPGSQWYVSIHIYDLERMTWITPLAETCTGWRGGNESVICDGVLYFLIYSSGVGIQENRQGLIAYDISSFCSHDLLKNKRIDVPCLLTCGRLMNLKEKLVMVGGIAKLDRCDIITGIGIWVLSGNEWEEISRMPRKFFEGLGELDDVFLSSGSDDLVYIQSYRSPLLLVFDMKQKQWMWSQKSPVAKKFLTSKKKLKKLLPVQLFTGFCFEPRLDIAP